MKKKNIKKALLMLGLSSIAITLVSCNGSSDANKTNTIPEASTNTPVESTNTPVVSTDDTTAPVTSNTDILPTESVDDSIKYTVKFYYYDEEKEKSIKLDEKQIKEGTKLKDIEAPAKDGYDVYAYKNKPADTAYLDMETEITKNTVLVVYYEKKPSPSNYDEAAYYPEYNLPKEEESALTEKAYLDTASSEQIDNFYQNGYVTGHISDFSEYENTEAYAKVSTPLEFLTAIKNAKYDYKTNDVNDGVLDQTLTSEGKIHVIEITKDLDLGYNVLSNEAKALGMADDFSKKNVSSADKSGIQHSFIQDTYGVSQIKVEGISNLLIYSKNGAKITHAGFKVTSSTNVVFRNLEMDEIWQWEDTNKSDTSFTIGDMDAYGWAYFKISFCGYIWIDHCTFGKAYDGIIDVSNPDYTTPLTVINNKEYYTYTRAPYGADGKSAVSITNCCFNAGSDDEDGYIYKMMKEIEESYQKKENKYLYYKSLRDDIGLSFKDILYGIAIPQKKAFLCGDNPDLSHYNLNLHVSIGNCYFKNIEDRLPKVRGGNAVVYNTIFDNNQYYYYRDKIKAATGISAFNSKFKCGLVSQGFVIGQGGSLEVFNSKVMGIDSVIKNNDSGVGGFKFNSVLIKKKLDDTGIYGSTDTTSFDSFIATTTNPISTDNFKINDPTMVFEPSVYDVDKLEDTLFKTMHIGVNTHFGSLYLKTKKTLK